MMSSQCTVDMSLLLHLRSHCQFLQTSSYHYLDSSGSAIQCMVGKSYSKIVTQVGWMAKVYYLAKPDFVTFSIAGFQAHTACQTCGTPGSTLVWVTDLEVGCTMLTTSGSPTTFLC